MLNFNSLMIGSQDPKSLAAFYEQVFQKKPDMVEGDWFGFSVGTCFLAIGYHTEVVGKATNPQRIILNFETPDVRQEFERIKALGATVVAEPYHLQAADDSAWIATLADSEGNYFQLMSPWKN
ncbi:hypothetical protein KBC79_05335 [Candidatus Woesebacteria bacterium]|nr:hypothetical protein [Candidatus Woesebacteria bacterium]MBP9820128.1 hypothetical protein [Candidatus Woesebacteria bacterium]